MDNAEIDWSKAPEWAVAHALHVFVGVIREVWVGDEQYQRLDQAKPFPYGGGLGDSRHNPLRHQFRFETCRPSPWNGKGLPPVGVVCELRCVTGGWGEAEIKYISATACVWLWKRSDGGEQVVEWMEVPYKMEFRPLRTPEQIAAEEREKGILQLARDAGFWWRDCMSITELPPVMAAIYDAGYRKTEGGAQ